jgi:hypothetical protein
MSAKYATLLLLLLGCSGSNLGYEVPDGTTSLPEERIIVSSDGTTQNKPDAPTGPKNTPDVPDSDGDGFGPAEDCDDSDLAINPAADDRCDGLDNDCNGIIDDGEDCPCTLAHRDKHAYLFCNHLAADWTSARLHCTQYGYELVQVDDQEEDDWLVETAVDFRTPYVWTGLNDMRKEGEWEWSTGQPAEFTSWNEGEPNNWGGREDCGIMYVTTEKKGRFNDRNCRDARPQFICETG